MLQQTYDDEYFMKNIVYAYVKSEGNGSVKLTVKIRYGTQYHILSMFQ